MLMFLELPEHVRDQTDDLGQPVLCCEASRLQTILYLVFGVLLALFGVGVAVLLVVALVAANQKQALPHLKLLLVGVIAPLFAGVGMLVKWWSLRGGSAIAFERGLARLQGQQCDVMRWQEVQIVRRGRPADANDITIGTPVRLTLVARDGREWVFSEAYSELKNLRAVVEECTLAHMIPAALEDLQAGEPLDFGSLAADQDGLKGPGDASLAWGSVSEAAVDKGMLVVGSKLSSKPYCKIPLYEVPNLHLLIALVEDYVRV
jgi:hypothetical protein